MKVELEFRGLGFRGFIALDSYNILVKLEELDVYRAPNLPSCRA